MTDYQGLCRFLSSEISQVSGVKEGNELSEVSELEGSDRFNNAMRLGGIVKHLGVTSDGSRVTDDLHEWITAYSGVNQVVRGAYDIPRYGTNLILLWQWSHEFMTFVRQNRTLIMDLPENVCIFNFNGSEQDE